MMMVMVMVMVMDDGDGDCRVCEYNRFWFCSYIVVDKWIYIQAAMAWRKQLLERGYRELERRVWVRSDTTSPPLRYLWFRVCHKLL